MAISQDLPVLHKSNGHGERGDHVEVAIVGAGPAGLMLATNLARFGISTKVLDKLPGPTDTGKADGLQPKSIETWRQMGLYDAVLNQGKKIYSMSYWESSPGKPLRRTGRQVQYPEFVGAHEPHSLTLHQGIIESVFLDDMAKRGTYVSRSKAFAEYDKPLGENGPIQVTSSDLESKKTETFLADYLVGCDGAHSKVREAMPGNSMTGEAGHSTWGVMDGVIDTDFPDLWHKAIVHSAEAGTVLSIAREQNMTRLYIELNAGSIERLDKELAVQEFMMTKAREVFHPFTLEWKTVEWVGTYVISQRVVKNFADSALKVFVAGDAAHTHSPKAAQGMNTSVHDSVNLAWKLNLVIRGIAKKELLNTYVEERSKIAQDLVEFDRGHVKAYEQGHAALEENFIQNVRFLSGVGVEYKDNLLIRAPRQKRPHGLQPGAFLTPARLTKYIDANPIDAQLDIPWLGQFRLYIILPSIRQGSTFLSELCEAITKGHILSSAGQLANNSYLVHPRPITTDDKNIQPKRYLAISELVTYALVTATPVEDFEISDLPQLLQKSKWTIYIADLMEAKGQDCIKAWMGEMEPTEAAIINVRPDYYVGSIERWKVDTPRAAQDAADWLGQYYGAFLNSAT